MWDLIGNQRVVTALAASIAQGRVSHAHLLTGPAGVGKMTVAVKLAQAVNCSGDAPPCGQCPQCRRTAQGKHADVQRIVLESGDDESEARTAILDGQVRDLQRLAVLEPFEGRARAFIIDGAERLTAQAANRLLKTLEEPPDNVYIILLGRDTARVLPTVVSRCRSYELRPVPAPPIEEALVSREGVDRELARQLARLADGRPGWAIAAARDQRVLEARREVMDEVATLLELGYHQRLAMAGDLTRDYARRREAVAQWLDLLRQWWHDLLLVKAGQAGHAVNVDRMEALEGSAAALSLQDIAGLLRSVEQTAEHLQHNVNARLALEVLLLEMPVIQGQPSLASRG